MQISKTIKKFQDGGAAPAADPSAQGGTPVGAAPQDPSAQGGGQDPIAQLTQMAQQALQTKDCNAALAVCDGLLQVLSQAQGQGGAPAPAEQGAPVYKKGGVLVRRK